MTSSFGPPDETPPTASLFEEAVRALLNVVAPPQPGKVLGRLRNGCIFMAVAVMLFPAVHALGTGTRMRVNAIFAAFLVVGFAVHVVRKKSADPWLAAAFTVVPAVVVWWAGRGALWGAGFAGLAVLSVAASAWHRSHPGRPSPFEQDPHPPDRSGIPKFMVWIGEGLLVVLIFETFAFETMNVPTGSMEPTIMGDSPRSTGDYLVMNHAVYAVRDPRRWEIAVFSFPLQRKINFVKRVVGLPGEHVEIRGGDIWVDGKPAAKPDLVQAGLWQEVFPQPPKRSRPKTVTSSWRASEDRGWRKDGDGLKVAPKGDSVTFAQMARAGAVADLRVSFTARLEPGATVVARITSRGHDVTFTVPGGDVEGSGWLEIEGGETVEIDAHAGASSYVQLAVADGRATAWLDGRVVARASVSMKGRSKQAVKIGAYGGPVRFHEIKVDADIEYRPAAGGLSAWDVPEGSYVVLGDNGRGSDDSRYWKVTEYHVRGQSAPYLATSQVPDETGRMTRNFEVKDGVIRFKDVDGVSRTFPKADLVKRVTGVPRPFVPRGHMLGRTVGIYFPFPPLSPLWRPRFLP